MYNFDILKSESPQHIEVLRYYKTTPCPTIQSDDSHGNNQRRLCFKNPCYHYHSHQEARRPVIDEQSGFLNYEAAPCQAFLGNFSCQEGNRCRMAHTQNELNYHPMYYKTEPCNNCTYINNPKLCPRYHPDENNRKAFIERAIMMANENSPTMAEARQKPGQFNLDLFKVRPCTKKGNHNLKICDYYHHDKDRRRPTNTFNYTPPMCSYVTRNSTCPNGDNCRYAHNKLEQLYHPERYKRKFCLHHPHAIHKCDYGGHCSFAHSEPEILIELLHNYKQDEYFYLNKYKSVFCPYIYEHDRNQCVYAHNPQDFRRDPNQYKYSATQCQYWSQGQIFSYEEGGCPNQMNCPNCHGWKELEYHPLYYKTKPCNNGKKCAKKDCPFYHSNAERRQTKVTSQLTQSLFNGSQHTHTPTSNRSNKSNMLSPKSSLYDYENQRMSSEKKSGGGSCPQSLIPMFNSFGFNNSDEEKLFDSKQGSYGDTVPNHNSFGMSTNFTEDEYLNSHSYKPRANTFDYQHQNNQFSLQGLSYGSDKGRMELARSLFSQPNNGSNWMNFQPNHDDKLDDYFSNGNIGNGMNLRRQNTNPNNNNTNSGSKADVDYDLVPGELNNDPNRHEAIVEKFGEISNEQFKKSFIYNLEKKGLSHTKPYLINPMIDLKALKTFSQRDFHLFPHISVEDKERIVKIIQDVLEEDALLSEVNTLNGTDFQVQGNSFSDDVNIFRIMGSPDKRSGMNYNLASQVERYPIH